MVKTGFLDFLLFPAPGASGKESTAGTGSTQAVILAAFYEEETGLEDELPVFLGKILAAAAPGLPERAAYIKSTKGRPYSFSRLARQQPLQYALIFGLAPKDLGLHFSLPLYQPVAVGSTIFILAHPLAAIYEERQKGGKQMSGELWRALKSLFQQA